MRNNKGIIIKRLLFLNIVVVLALAMIFACNTFAGLLEETCGAVYYKLGSGPYESLTKSIEIFTDNGNYHYGCVIRLSGNADKAKDAQRPGGLFGYPLPYCPAGKLPADITGDLLNKDGWCGDKMADGPDGTSYTALKQNVFCTVEGHWDGGDDSDPKYVPSSLYEVIVKCANMTEREHR